MDTMTASSENRNESSSANRAIKSGTDAPRGLSARRSAAMRVDASWRELSLETVSELRREAIGVANPRAVQAR